MKTQPSRFSSLLTLTVSMLVMQSAHAVDTATSAWNGNTVLWTTAGNWGGGVPSTTISALFDSTFVSAFQPQLQGTSTVQGIYLQDGAIQDVTITGLTSARILNINGDAELGGQVNAGIMLDDVTGTNNNLTIGNLVTTTLTNNTGFYVNSGGTLTLNGSGTLNLNANTLTLGGNNAAGNIIISQVITATAGSINVNTAGTVTLSGANAFTGGVTLTAGKLNMNSATALGAVGSAFTINGGTIDQTVSSVTLTANNLITIGGNFTYTGTNNLNLGTGAITNAGDRTITLNGTSKTLTMGGIMTNTSGAIQTTTVNGVGNTLSLGGYALSNSATNYINVFNGSSNVTITGVVSNGGTSTASGLTYSGTGTLTLGGVNTFTGQLTVANGTLSIATINSVSANGTLGNSDINRAVILGSTGGNTGTLKFTAVSGSSDKTFTLAAGGTGAFDITTALTLSGTIDGSGNLTKTGAGNLTLSQSGTNTGVWRASQFTGVTTINSGKIILGVYSTGNNFGAGSLFGLQKSIYDTTGSSASLDVTALGVGNGTLWLGGLQGSVALATAVSGYGQITYLNLSPQTGTSVSYGGVIANGAAGMIVDKLGPGTQTLTAANTYSGATNIYAGTLAFSGATGSALNSAFTVRGGTVELDNSGGTFINRLADGTALSLGSLTLKSYNGAGAQTETVGNTTFAVGGKVTINNGLTAGDQTTLAMGVVTRSVGAAIDFVGTGGSLGSGSDSPNVTATSGLTNTNSILHWATVGGNQWAESNANSIRAYSGGFTTLAAATNTTQAQQTGAATLSGALNTNSLNVISDGTSNILALGGNTISFGSTNVVGTLGAILKSGTNGYVISGGTIRVGTGGLGTELITHVDGGALTISANLNTAIVNIAKGGTGNLILSGTRNATMAGAISIAGGDLEFQGATTTLNGLITGGGGLVVNLNAGNTLSITNNQANTFSGRVLVKGGIFAGGGFGAIGLSAAPGTGNNTAGAVGIATGSAGGMNNIELNGGLFSAPYVLGRYLGAAPDQFQISGGVSGFTGVMGSTAIGGSANYEVVWGSTYFQPTTFVLQDATNTAGLFVFSNKIDLNGATRTIAVNSILAANGATISGAIRTSSGTAGLTKIGVGTLTLSGVNTYNGATTISAGTLSVGVTANLGAAASNLVFDGGTLQITGTTLTNFSGIGHTVLFNSGQTVGLDINNAANIFTADQVLNQGSGGLTKLGAGTLMLNQTNTYTGTTTVSAGILNTTMAAALPGYNVAAKVFFNGGILGTQIGGSGWTTGEVDTLLTNATKTSGSLGIDTTNGSLTQWIAFTTTNLGATLGLAKLGTNTLILDQVNNYTGGTTVNAGTLQLSGSGTLGSTSGTLTVNTGGALDLNGTTQVVGGINGTGGMIALNSADNRTLSFGTGNTAGSYAGVISDGTGVGVLSLTKNGSAIQILNGVNTFTGDIAINAGTLQIGTNATANGAKLGGASGNYAGNIINNGTLDIQTDANMNLSGVISGSGALLQRYASTLTLSGANTYTGKTTINSITNGSSATLVVSSFNSLNGGTPLLVSSSLGAPTTLANATIQLGGGNSTPNPTLRYTGAAATGETTDRVINFTFNSGAIRTLDASGSGLLKFTSAFTATGQASGGITLAGTGYGELAGALPTFGSGAFTKSGTGTWRLSGAGNLYVNPTTVSDGTLIVTKARTTAMNAALTVAANKRFIYAPTAAGALNLGTGVLTLGNGTTTRIGTALGGTASQSAITSTGAASLTGTGKVDIYGITGVGPTAGTNNLITALSGLGGGTYTLGTVYNNTNFTVDTFTRSATAISVNVTAQTAITTAFWKGGLTGNTNVWAASDGSANSNWTETAGGAVQALTPGSTATVTISATAPTTAPTATVLGADMSILGLVISDTTNGLGLNDDGNYLTIGTGGITMDITVPTSTIAANVILGGNQTWTNDSANTLNVSGQISGSSNLTKAGTGTVALSGFNSYSGTTTISAGTLSANSSVALGNTSATNTLIFDGGTLQATGTITSAASRGVTMTSTGIIDTNSNAVRIAGVITGAGGLTKDGAGTLTLTNTNSYIGATTVSVGTLLVDGSISSSSLTTVASTATIGGSGTVGALTVSTGGFISGGDSAGDNTSIFNINGAYSQAGLYTVDIAGMGAGDFDRINVTGAVDITGGSLTAMFTSGSYTNGDLIFILTNDLSDAIIGTYGSAQGATVVSYGGFDWSISYEADSVGNSFTGGNDIALMAIPEPKTALLGCLGILLLLRRRR